MAVIEADTPHLVGKDANGLEYKRPQGPTFSTSADRALWPGILPVWYIKNADQVSLSFRGVELSLQPVKSVLVTCCGT